MPIFIVGMPRSGRTLVEQILASHPKVYGAGELTEFIEAVARLGGRWRFVLPAAVRLGRPKSCADSAQAILMPSAAAPAAERITDKMPANFRFAGLIHLALPNARIIHMRRDPVDTCLSCFSMLFAGELPTLTILASSVAIIGPIRR